MPSSPISHNSRLSPFIFQQNSSKELPFTYCFLILSSHSLLNPLQSGFVLCYGIKVSLVEPTMIYFHVTEPSGQSVAILFGPSAALDCLLSLNRYHHLASGTLFFLSSALTSLIFPAHNYMLISP